MEQLNYTTNKSNMQKFYKTNFNHLNQTDRMNIEKLLSRKKDPNYTGHKITYAYIANVIGVNKSTISREIKRGNYIDVDPTNGSRYTRYLASYGQAVYDENIKRSHYKYKLEKGSPELAELSEILNLGTDPLTAINLYLQKHNAPFPLCEKSIYNYFHRGWIKIKRGIINPRTSHKSFVKTPKMVCKGDNIALRPNEANTREVFGHWEGDLIVGARNTSKECLLTLIERQTRLYLAFKVANKEMKTITKVFDVIEQKIGLSSFREIFKTITFDNGTEFRDFQGMEESILRNCSRTKIYYANPYHSWERGSNEHGNKMMRKYFPKGTDFSKISASKILDATNKINFSVRRILSCNSAADMLEGINHQYFEIFKTLRLTNPFTKYLQSEQELCYK